MTAAAPHSAEHIPVMRDEMLAHLAPREGEVYVDATFGAGGYSHAILKQASCRVYGVDRDPDVAPFAEQLQQEFGGRFVLLTGCFSEMISLLAEQGIEQVDGIVMDLGVSSMQLDRAERGFSFMRDGALDMRQSQTGESAADIVNNMAEGDLADILYHYGEERQSRRIARAIITARTEKPITTTLQLADLIKNTIHQSPKQRTHPATRSFQALRIYVNRELEELEKALEASKTLLKPGGRLVVISFHSLEDRIVKRFFTDCSRENWGGSRHQPLAEALPSPLFSRAKRKAAAPSEAELAINPRSRSAKLRSAIRTEEPA